MDDKLLYIAVVLDKESQERLYGLVQEVVSVNKKNNYKIYCHHMTVAFRDKISQEIYDYAKANEGRTFNLTPISIGVSNEALALGVKCDCPSANKIKHITLATFNGARPVESNNIAYWNNIDSEFILTGTLQFIYKK